MEIILHTHTHTHNNLILHYVADPLGPSAKKVAIRQKLTINIIYLNPIIKEFVSGPGQLSDGQIISWITKLARGEMIIEILEILAKIKQLRGLYFGT